jgi:AAA domain
MSGTPPLLVLAEGRKPRPRKAPSFRPKEIALHMAVAKVLREHCLPEWLWTHIPAGEILDKRTAGKLKQMGTKPGWPDFVLIPPSGQLHCLAPAAVVIDTLNRSLTGSESDDRDMAAYVKAADAIRDAFGCAVIIVHHCGHEGTRPRGHSSLIGAVDAQIAVKRDATDNIIATVELMKDGSRGDEFASKLEVIEIGLDDDGDKITSCVIVPVDGLQPSRSEPRPKLTKGAKIALDALHDAIGERGEVPPVSNHIPGGMKCATIEQWLRAQVRDKHIRQRERNPHGFRSRDGKSCRRPPRRYLGWFGVAVLRRS